MDEIGLVLQDVFFNLGVAMGADKSIGVILRRQRQHLDADAFLEQHVHTANGSFDTGGVTVKHLGDIAGKAADGVDMSLGQCGARRGDDVLESCLMHRDDIGITLDDKAFVLLADLSLGLI